MKPSMLGLLIAAIAFAGSTAYLTVQLQSERAQADQVAESVGALNARIAELEKAREQAFVSGTFEDNAPGQGAVAMGPPLPPGEKNAATLENVEISRNPNLPPPQRSEAFQKMMRSNLRANNKRMYADLGPHLGLSKEDTSKLIDMLTDQQVENFGRMREGNSDPADRKRALDEAARDNQAELESFLGVSKAASLREYQETIPARQETEALARQLEGADAPLSAEQQKRMLAAIIEERKRIPMPKMSDAASPEDYSKAYTEWQGDYSERVNAQAASLLSSGQLAAYNEYQQWQKEMREQVATRRQSRGQRIPGSSIEFSSVTMPVAGDAVMMTAPAEESPRKP